MIDDGETDWKILVIDVNDPLAATLNDSSDIPKEVADKVFTFLRDYKVFYLLFLPRISFR